MGDKITMDNLENIKEKLCSLIKSMNADALYKVLTILDQNGVKVPFNCSDCAKMFGECQEMYDPDECRKKFESFISGQK